MVSTKPAAAQLKSLSWLHQALIRAQSVCRVTGSAGRGTGFVISGGILLTNNHVLRTSAEASHASVEFNFEEDEFGNIKEVVKYSLNTTTFITSKELDCTAVRINDRTDVPVSRWGALEFVSSNDQIAIGDHVAIIQHPRGGPKQICLTDNKVVNLFADKLQYTTDTMPGSSGAPVFNDEWRVVAIHHAGGNLPKNKKNDRIFANQGVLIQAILADGGFCGLLSRILVL